MLFRSQDIDRVVGLPGENVIVRNGSIYINGYPLPSQFAPTNGAGAIPNMEITAGRNQYVILPSNMGVYVDGNINVAGVLREVSLTDRSQITGVLWYRIRPFSRMGKVE